MVPSVLWHHSVLMTEARRDLERALGTLVGAQRAPGGGVLTYHAGGGTEAELFAAFEAVQREERRLEREERRRIRPGSYLEEYGWGLALLVPWVALVIVKLILG